MVATGTAEVRRAPPGTAEVEILARGRGAFVARLKIAPGAKIPEHRDATEETIVILEGGGRITIDGTTYDVGPGDAIFMAPEALVSYENGPRPTTAVQVFAGPGPAAKYDAWTPVESGGNGTPVKSASSGTR